MDKLEIKGEISLSSREREVYRTLRTNLEFTGVENRVIAVTSCTPNDGKSTVAYNLALALAESGRNTLLIDADMRKSVMVRTRGIFSWFQREFSPATLQSFWEMRDC